MNQRLTLPCTDCRADLYQLGEYDYMLLDEVWRAMLWRSRRRGQKVSTFDYLCVGCLVQRLGRPLCASDFDWTVPLNSRDPATNSPRLKKAKSHKG